MGRSHRKVDSLKVRKAIKAARLMKRIFPLVPSAALIFVAAIALVAREPSVLTGGIVVIVIGSIAACAAGLWLTRCPRCGQIWWSPISTGRAWLPFILHAEMVGDETDTYQCRRCHLELGPHMHAAEAAERQQAAPPPADLK